VSVETFKNQDKAPRAVRRKRSVPTIPIYDESEREGLRAAGRFNAQLMDFIRPKVVAGVTTNQLDHLIHEYTLDHGHAPADLGYQGFPKSVCTSVNEVVCHGIPDDRALREGDIINVDVTTIVDGWYGDQSETFLIGKVSDTARRLVQVTFDCLYRGIRAIKPNGPVIDIGAAIYDHAEASGFAVVREYQGHGLGRQYHQDPGIPHYPHQNNASELIPPGVCFTIEPMLNVGTWETVLDHKDKWTVRTKDGSLSAQFEHTILMTESGPEILTLTKDGPQEGHVF
jgi:methionyl aminopeptidase